MPIKTSEEAFREAIEKGREKTLKNTQTSKRIKELREELNKIIVKSTFASSEAEKHALNAKAKGLQRQIEALQKLNE